MQIMRAEAGSLPADPPAPAVEAAFEDVYREHAAGVYRFCLSQLRDPSRAEEAAASALASACLSFERVRPAAAAVRPWLFRIARNAVVDEARRTRRSRLLFDRLRNRSEPALDVEDLTALREDVRAVAVAAAALPARDRTVIGLRAAAGLSHAEVAELMGISEAAAKVAAHRALHRLRGRVERTGERR
jgi:RNA polymerase sigma factor (sigma-70 family)